MGWLGSHGIARLALLQDSHLLHLLLLLLLLCLCLLLLLLLQLWLLLLQLWLLLLRLLLLLLLLELLKLCLHQGSVHTRTHAARMCASMSAQTHAHMTAHIQK